MPRRRDSMELLFGMDMQYFRNSAPQLRRNHSIRNCHMDRRSIAGLGTKARSVVRAHAGADSETSVAAARRSK